MAEPLKRKRLEKSLDDALPVFNPASTYCCRCGGAFSRKKGYFPVSHSPMYRGSGYLPWCNSCIDEMYEEYRRDLDDRAAMRRMCMKMDLYWNDSIYDMVERQAGVTSRIRTYIGKTNIVRFIDKTFDDTLREEADALTHSQRSSSASDADKSEGVEGSMDEFTVTQSIIDFWGAGYSRSFYAELEKKYKEWTGGNDITDPSERSLYRQICLLEVCINKDAAEGKPIKDSVNALNNLLGSMNLKPSQQKTDADAELEKMPLGVGLEKWESKRPLPVTDEKLRDVNHRIRDITTWYLGHGAKMVNLRGAHVQMYDDAMNELRVKLPEYEDDDDDTMLTNIFGNSKAGGVDEQRKT